MDLASERGEAGQVRMPAMRRRGWPTQRPGRRRGLRRSLRFSAASVEQVIGDDPVSVHVPRVRIQDRPTARASTTPSGNPWRSPEDRRRSTAAESSVSWRGH